MYHRQFTDILQYKFTAQIDKRLMLKTMLTVTPSPQSTHTPTHLIFPLFLPLFHTNGMMSVFALLSISQPNQTHGTYRTGSIVTLPESTAGQWECCANKERQGFFAETGIPALCGRAVDTSGAPPDNGQMVS